MQYLLTWHFTSSRNTNISLCYLKVLKKIKTEKKNGFLSIKKKKKKEKEKKTTVNMLKALN